MGKWTVEYHDDVLRNKLKSLIFGACKRAKLEKGEPSITYEAFVEDLDEGDAFTSTMIDLLVTELADRRTRPNPNDKQLISERTAKSLRMQAASLHIYRGRPSRQRRRFTSEYSTAPDEIMTLTDEEEELEALANNGIEGINAGRNLYEAYLPSYHFLEGSSRTSEPSPLSAEPPTAATPDVDRETVTSPRPVSPPLPIGHFRNSFWGTGGTGSTSLARQTTIRRPIRSRTIDFNDFTSRRRSVIRQTNPHGTESPRPEESLPSARTPILPFHSSFPARRFFQAPWSQIRRHSDNEETPASAETRAVSPQTDSPDPSNSLPGGQSSSQLWYSLTGSGPTADWVEWQGASRRQSSERRLPTAPRLRRGGVRAPESIMVRTHHHVTEDPSSTSHPHLPLRYPSPISSSSRNTFNGEDGTITGMDDVVDSTAVWRSGLEGSVSQIPVLQQEEARQLLTPRSISPVATGENQN
ncbi:hypothetical protein C8Q75DRAFT_742994 [Abortiporus biennis]|nr:hypothetical protein C8Q75DRAFT_742994 [Abortiporus biennis]